MITVRAVLVQLIKHSPFLSGQFHVWCRCCLQVPQQTRFGLNMQSSPGTVTSARSPLPLITYIVPFCLITNALLQTLLIILPHSPVTPGGNMGLNTTTTKLHNIILPGCRGRIRVFRQEAAGHSVLSPQLLWRVRQCRRDDVCGRDTDVLLPGKNLCIFLLASSSHHFLLRS